MLEATNVLLVGRPCKHALATQGVPRRGTVGWVSIPHHSVASSCHGGVFTVVIAIRRCVSGQSWYFRNFKFLKWVKALTTTMKFLFEAQMIRSLWPSCEHLRGSCMVFNMNSGLRPAGHLRCPHCQALWRELLYAILNTSFYWCPYFLAIINHRPQVYLCVDCTNREFTPKNVS